MKDLLRILLVCVLIASITLSVAADSIIDWASYSTEEVEQIYAESFAEMMHRSQKAKSSTISSDKEITFRSVPWTCIPEVLSASMADSGISLQLLEGNCQSWESDFYWTGTLAPIMMLDNGGFFSNNSPKNMTVAGYPVKTLYTYFAYDYDKENVYKDVEQSKFYKARYDIDAIDTKATYDILNQKLSQLYGEGVKHLETSGWTSSAGHSTKYTDWIVWYGANNTGVYLWYNYVKFDDGHIEDETISIIYGKSDSMIMLQNLKAALAYQQLKEALENTDGL